MSDKVTVAIIAGQLVVGGAERQLYLWLANMDRERFNPVVITLHPGHGDYWEKPIENLNIPLYRIAGSKLKFKRLIEIIGILRLIKPSLIHGWHLFSSPYAGLTAYFLRVRSLGSLRDSYRIFSKNKISALLTSICVDAIIANSCTASHMLEQCKLRKNQEVFTITNAIQPPLNDTIQNISGIDDLINSLKEKRLIVSLGRLDQKKRFDLLLHIIAKVKQIVQNFHLVIIGDGPEYDHLKNLVISLHLQDNVSFLGEIPEAATLLSEFDIFAFTSTDEGMPNVIMEAAMAGLPIVTWRLPFYEELLEHGKSALLVEPGDCEGMKDAILALMDSPELRASLGQAARKHMLEYFSLEAYVKKMTAVYEYMLAKKTRSRKGVK